MVLISAMIAVPLLRYTATVAKQNQVVRQRTIHIEAVKGALRASLAQPKALFQACGSAGLTTGVLLGSASLTTPVETKCFKLSAQGAIDTANEIYGVASVQYGTSAPTGVTGNVAPAGASFTAWTGLISASIAKDRIWVPALPPRTESLRSSTPYTMPSTYPACRVFFPGTYPDALTITGTTPVYFASGVYYFSKPVTISDTATVVVGGGSTSGCVASDQEAAFAVKNPPTSHGITGLGATFVLGSGARLVISSTQGTSTPGAMKVVFNKRYVGDTPSELAVASSAGVSIETVNGDATARLTNPAMPIVAYSRAGKLQVPVSTVAGAASPIIENNGYWPATTVATDTVTTSTSIIDVNLTGARPATIVVPGYVSAPMGVVRVMTSATAAPATSVSMSGGVTAAAFDIGATRPKTFVLGLSNPIVQQLLKITSTTQNGLPQITSSAIVQVNESGAYAVNHWEVG
jgi:hypothetical protein